jgi:hypothetical protein
MTYEGVYRKTGGSSLSKYITQLFDRGNYDSFDLQDMDKFNDINSVTSVMKSYFRTLPDPLLTYKLHEDLVAAASECFIEPLGRGVFFFRDRVDKSFSHQASKIRTPSRQHCLH